MFGFHIEGKCERGFSKPYYFLSKHIWLLEETIWTIELSNKITGGARISKTGLFGFKELGGSCCTPMTTTNWGSHKSPSTKNTQQTQEEHTNRKHTI